MSFFKAIHVFIARQIATMYAEKYYGYTFFYTRTIEPKAYEYAYKELDMASSKASSFQKMQAEFYMKVYELASACKDRNNREKIVSYWEKITGKTLYLSSNEDLNTSSSLVDNFLSSIILINA